MSVSKRKTRVSLTNEVKLNTIMDVKAGKKSQQQAADTLGVERSTIAKWVKKKPKLAEVVADGKGNRRSMVERFRGSWRVYGRSGSYYDYC